MSVQEKDTYFVAVKLFLEKDGKLFIFKDKFGDWDLPGGRIKRDEFATPLNEVIARKMKEEIGDAVTYSVGQPIVFMRHERVEATQEQQAVRIFAIGYEAQLLSGEPQLSDMHTQSQWVDIATFEPEKYFTGGWLTGVQEYLSLKRK